MITWSTIPRHSAGPETHTPVTIATVGTTPEASTSARAARPHPCSELTPSRMSAPVVSSHATKGSPSPTAVRTARSMASAPASPTAPWCFPPSTRSTTTARPSMSTTWADALSLRCPMMGVAARGAGAFMELTSRDAEPRDRLPGAQHLSLLGEDADQVARERAADRRRLARQLHETDRVARREVLPLDTRTPDRGREHAGGGGDDGAFGDVDAFPVHERQVGHGRLLGRGAGSTARAAGRLHRRRVLVRACRAQMAAS